MYDHYLQESEASWVGIPGQENVYMQQEFDLNTLRPTQGFDALVPTDLSTPLWACHQTIPPLTMDIVNGELSPIAAADGTTSTRAVLSSTQMFQYDKLARELPALYSSISHDASASKILEKLIDDIIDPSPGVVPEYSRVDVLVVTYEGRFHCPFAGCRKNNTGWALPCGARDHIWIDHLSRRFPCLWEGCQQVFSRPYDRDRHVKEHKGLGETFVCPTCNKGFPRKWNLGRHIETTVCNRPRC